MKAPIMFATGLDTASDLQKHLEKSDNGEMTIALETHKGNNLVLSDVESYFENPDDMSCDYSVLLKGKGNTELTP